MAFVTYELCKYQNGMVGCCRWRKDHGYTSADSRPAAPRAGAMGSKKAWISDAEIPDGHDARDF
eukprot:scaffold25893_cov115-Amphora_coffeaeformis.AAC.2